MGECPPVLIWFITGLQAYVVLDGHARLRAFQLEGKVPEYMVLKPVIVLGQEIDLKPANRLYHSFEQRQNNPRKQPLSVEHMNNILLQVYNPNAVEHYTSKSLAARNFEAQWLKEVGSFAGRPGTDEEELECMIYG